jgi:hypothetical protein
MSTGGPPKLGHWRRSEGSTGPGIDAQYEHRRRGSSTAVQRWLGGCRSRPPFQEQERARPWDARRLAAPTAANITRMRHQTSSRLLPAVVHEHPAGESPVASTGDDVPPVPEPPAPVPPLPGAGPPVPPELPGLPPVEAFAPPIPPVAPPAFPAPPLAPPVLTIEPPCPLELTPAPLAPPAPAVAPPSPPAPVPVMPPAPPA